MIKNITAIALFLFIGISAFSQKPDVESGSFDAIKSIKKWSVSVEHEGVEIHKKPAYDEFVKERVDMMNAEMPEAGDEWAEDWEQNFDRKYNYKFSQLMNKYLEKVGVEVGKDLEGAEGSIVIKTYWIWLGYANAMMVKPSKVSSKIHFYDADGKELVVVDMVESPGAPNAFAGGQTIKFGFNPEGEFARLIESYAKCGKDLAGYMAKKVYK